MVIFFFPQFNFVGRILGPRGLTAKQLEAETGCKIMVRGKGSMRDKKKVSLCFPCFDFFGAGGGAAPEACRSSQTRDQTCTIAVTQATAVTTQLHLRRTLKVSP